MADQVVDRIIWDAAQCINEAAKLWADYGSYQGDTWTPFVFEDYGGYRSIYIEVTDGTATNGYRFVCMELAVGEVLSLRALLSRPGFNPPFTFYWLDDPEYWSSFDQLADDWETWIGGLYYEAIDTWTTGTSEEPIAGRITSFAGKVGSARFSMPCLADSEALSYTLQLYAAEYIQEGPVWQFVVNPPRVEQMTPSNPSSNTQVLLKIAEALSDLAHKTTVTTLNNQGAIAVLDSSEIITP
jgi:hypothetical protein